MIIFIIWHAPGCIPLLIIVVEKFGILVYLFALKILIEVLKYILASLLMVHVVNRSR